MTSGSFTCSSVVDRAGEREWLPQPGHLSRGVAQAQRTSARLSCRWQHRRAPPTPPPRSPTLIPVRKSTTRQDAPTMKVHAPHTLNNYTQDNTYTWIDVVALSLHVFYVKLTTFLTVLMLMIHHLIDILSPCSVAVTGLL